MKLNDKMRSTGGYLLWLMSLTVLVSGCDQAAAELPLPLADAAAEPALSVYNPEAVIPPQCYTKTEQQFNPCYTCHQTHPFGTRPNRMSDQTLQGDYDFSELGVTNRWDNLFKDRRQAIAAIPDADIQAYVRQDNYSALSARLQAQDWQGYVPDLEQLQHGSAAFDSQGFALDGSHWVAFNYKPLPSTFWPTNGSTDDVMLRLPAPFRQNAQGRYQRDIYLLNLSILEAAIKNLSQISIPEVNENKIGKDLNQDGRLTETQTLVRPDFYLGAAAQIAVTPFLYPKGVEFLHTVRYVGVDSDGEIVVPPRLKELRYMRKIAFFTPAQLASRYGNEKQEKLDGNLPRYPDAGDWGLDNKMGWQLSGFIEDAEGQLRPQRYEENFFCMGCHTSVGATIDHTFAFARKVTGKDGWGYINLKGMPDAPAAGQQQGEIYQYLQRVCGGDEFRQNQEMKQKFFTAGCEVNQDKVLQSDVYQLITPSAERALQLNKAYYLIVREQSYIQGRDAVLQPAVNVYEAIDQDVTPLSKEHRIGGDIRLDW